MLSSCPVASSSSEKSEKVKTKRGAVKHRQWEARQSRLGSRSSESGPPSQQEEAPETRQVEGGTATVVPNGSKGKASSATVEGAVPGTSVQLPPEAMHESREIGYVD